MQGKDDDQTMPYQPWKNGGRRQRTMEYFTSVKNPSRQNDRPAMSAEVFPKIFMFLDPLYIQSWFTIQSNLLQVLLVFYHSKSSFHSIVFWTNMVLHVPVGIGYSTLKNQVFLCLVFCIYLLCLSISNTYYGEIYIQTHRIRRVKRNRTFIRQFIIEKNRKLINIFFC